MSNFEDFKPRDRVAHIMLGDGTVTHVDEFGVHVRFNRTRSNGNGGRKHFEGIYDRRWFALNPTYLFHRSNKRGELADPGGKPK